MATHASRKELFLEAGRRIVDITKRYYEQDDESVLPRNVACKAAFVNAMTLDVSMGGSTNTVCIYWLLLQKPKLILKWLILIILAVMYRAYAKLLLLRQNTIWKMYTVLAA